MEKGASEDPGLIGRTAAGDVAAFEKLYDLHAPSLYPVLLRILGNVEDAKEALQETFVQAWNRAATFDPARGSEIAWLVSIARSRGIDRLRSRRLRDVREQEAGAQISLLAPLVDKGGAAEDVLANERQRLLRDALLQLPESQRSTLELAYFEGLSQTEIAARLNEPLGTVKTRMQLGMKKLRERLHSVYGR